MDPTEKTYEVTIHVEQPPMIELDWDDWEDTTPPDTEEED
jgi:hypothetical protein